MARIRPVRHDDRLTLVEHLDELRTRLIICAITIAVAFAVSLAFTVVPTPLWAIYQRHDGYSTIAVTVAFAAYAFGVIVSLFLAGHLSDRWGRRRVLLPAILLEAAAAALFLTSTSLGVVIVARVLSGLGIGMITATATAHKRITNVITTAGQRETIPRTR